MTDTVYDEHGRPEPPLTAGELDTLTGFLDFHRATFAWKTAGLDAKQLSTTVAASSLTLGGLLKHLTKVEDAWFSRALHDREWSAPWNEIDWAATPDHEFAMAAGADPDELRAGWRAAVDRSRELLADALRRGDLDQLADRRWTDGRAPSLRWILIHMVEEYSRHNGHADLIREAVDGLTGE